MLYVIRLNNLLKVMLDIVVIDLIIACMQYERSK